MSSNESWHALDAALKECGYFARLAKPGDGKFLGTKYWPPPTYGEDSLRGGGACAECRGAASTTHIMWWVWNEELCRHWTRAWLDAARLIDELALTNVVVEQAPDDEIWRITHKLFVRILTSEQPSTEPSPVALELARERSNLLDPRQDPPDLRRFRLGEYFDIWLWPRLCNERGPVQSQSHASARQDPRVPEGWIFATDASTKYGVKRSTLQDWITSLPEGAKKMNKDLHRVLLHEDALRELLSRKGRLER